MFTLVKPGQRKATYGLLSLLILTSGAFYLRATFAELSTAINWWLGFMLTGHVVQQATSKPAPPAE